MRSSSCSPSLSSAGNAFVFLLFFLGFRFFLLVFFYYYFFFFGKLESLPAAFGVFLPLLKCARAFPTTKRKQTTSETHKVALYRTKKKVECANTPAPKKKKEEQQLRSPRYLTAFPSTHLTTRFLRIVWLGLFGLLGFSSVPLASDLVCSQQSVAAKLKRPSAVRSEPLRTEWHEAARSCTKRLSACSESTIVEMGRQCLR